MILCEVDGVRARTAPLHDRAAHASAEALGQAWFGPNFSASCFDAWAARCTNILFVAESAETGDFLGYADQLFLAPGTAAALRAGQIDEAQFTEHDVLGDEAVAQLPAGSAVTLYLAGMCVTHPGTPHGRAAAQALRGCRRALLAEWRARGFAIHLLLAAATEAGRKIATRAGGVLIGTGDARVDGYDLYELPDLPDW
jgi:hypothetical protein